MRKRSVGLGSADRGDLVDGKGERCRYRRETSCLVGLPGEAWVESSAVMVV